MPATLPTQQPFNSATKEFLRPIAQKVFWWGNTEDWLENPNRFIAQVMTYGDWDDVIDALELIGDKPFQLVLQNPPPGVIDTKSWNFWHMHYHMPVPPMPTRKL